MRRVGENQIKGSATLRKLAESSKDILYSDLYIFGFKSGCVKILSDYLRMPRGKFDANDGSRASTKAFQAKRAGSGEKFQHLRVENAFSKAVEDSLFHQVWCGPHVQTFGCFE